MQVYVFFTHTLVCFVEEIKFTYIAVYIKNIPHKYTNYTCMCMETIIPYYLLNKFLLSTQIFHARINIFPQIRRKLPFQGL